MNPNLKLSIITPNYNYATFIGETIESVINQDYEPFEYIIVDDGSTDNSVEVINEYIEKYPSKIILIQQENRGQSAAINVGLHKATGDIIGWINSDDTFCKNTFSEIAQMFKKKPNSDIVFGDINIMDFGGDFIYRKRHLEFNYLSGCFLSFASIMNSNAVFWKKEAMLKSGLLLETLLSNMDGEFFSRLFTGMKVSKINKALANFRKQPHIKASEKKTNWDEIVENEALLELVNSYKRLSLSNYIPYKYAFLIRFLVLFKRIILRTVKMHYAKQFFEIKKYKLLKNKNAS